MCGRTSPRCIVSSFSLCIAIYLFLPVSTPVLLHCTLSHNTPFSSRFVAIVLEIPLGSPLLDSRVFRLLSPSVLTFDVHIVASPLLISSRATSSNPLGPYICIAVNTRHDSLLHTCVITRISKIEVGSLVLSARPSACLAARCLDVSNYAMAELC